MSGVNDWRALLASPEWEHTLFPALEAMREAIVNAIAVERDVYRLWNLQGQLVSISAVLALPITEIATEELRIANERNNPGREEDEEDGPGRRDREPWAERWRAKRGAGRG